MYKISLESHNNLISSETVTNHTDPILSSHGKKRKLALVTIILLQYKLFPFSSLSLEDMELMKNEGLKLH